MEDEARRGRGGVIFKEATRLIVEAKVRLLKSTPLADSFSAHLPLGSSGQKSVGQQFRFFGSKTNPLTMWIARTNSFSLYEEYRKKEKSVWPI